MKRGLVFALATLPAVLSMVVFSDGFNAWFQQDDFAHLKLAAQTQISGLPGLLIRPIAQGTFRPLSERLFYWAGYHWGGLEPAPFRAMCFLFHALNCVLFFRLLLRLGGGALAAMAGACVWAVNPCLTLPVTWTATTNQVFWISCVLAAFYAFVLYCENGRPRFLALSWIIYLTGYGMLDAGVRANPMGGWITELAGELSAVGGSRYSGAGTALGSGRVLWTDGVVGTWMRATGHGSGRTHATHWLPVSARYRSLHGLGFCSY